MKKQQLQQHEQLLQDDSPTLTGPARMEQSNTDSRREVLSLGSWVAWGFGFAATVFGVRIRRLCCLADGPRP